MMINANKCSDPARGFLYYRPISFPGANRGNPIRVLSQMDLI